MPIVDGPRRDRYRGDAGVPGEDEPRATRVVALIEPIDIACGRRPGDLLHPPAIAVVDERSRFTVVGDRQRLILEVIRVRPPAAADQVAVGVVVVDCPVAAIARRTHEAGSGQEDTIPTGSGESSNSPSTATWDC